MIEDHAVPRVGVGVVERPRSSAKIGKAAGSAVTGDDDIGEVDGPVLVALPFKDGSGQKLHRWRVQAHQPDIR
jgi:hypothetical protein